MSAIQNEGHKLEQNSESQDLPFQTVEKIKSEHSDAENTDFEDMLSDVKAENKYEEKGFLGSCLTSGIDVQLHVKSELDDFELNEEELIIKTEDDVDQNIKRCRMSSVWTSEKDEILINFVRMHEEIYNIKCKGYRNTQYKQKLWCDIGVILNKTDSDCSKRWCYIRDYYVRRKAKPGNGSCGEAARKRSNLLSFLDTLASLQRSTTTSVFEDENQGSEVMNKTQDTCERNGSQRLNMKDIIHDNKDDNKQNKNKCRDIRLMNFVKKQRDNLHVQERLNPLMQTADRNSSAEDENDLFFRAMAKIVKKLPRHEQAQLRMKIGVLVGNAELRCILKAS